MVLPKLITMAAVPINYYLSRSEARIYFFLLTCTVFIITNYLRTLLIQQTWILPYLVCIAGLKTLINKCCDYSTENSIQIVTNGDNGDKTEFLVSGYPTSVNSYISLDHHHIEPTSKLKHLGFIWSNRKKNHPFAVLEDVNLQERINTFWAVVHSLTNGGVC